MHLPMPQHVVGTHRNVVAPSAEHGQLEVCPDMIAECPVSTGGVRTQRAEPMIYVALSPSIVKENLLLTGDASGSHCIHQPVEA